jgi:superfamily II DNA or RNA helicase
MAKWKAEITETTGVVSSDVADRPKPWKKQQSFNKSDVVGKMHLVLGDGVYIDTLNLMPRIQNQIRSLAAFDNPIFYKNKRLGYSNYYNFSAVYMGKDIDGYILIPRGLRDTLLTNCKEAGIEYDIVDHREKGRPIRVSFNGELRTGQDLAADRMLSYDYGVLSATTAFGKTVVCSYLISQRKVNTLILLQSKDLLEQWVEELNKFLLINEEPPTYKTKTGREKKRDSVIGILTGNKNTLTGIIDVAMVGSMYSKGNFNDFINSYGMVIMDECHHCGSNTSVEVMQKVNARYVYGVSATPKRGDNMEKIIHMLLGPIRHSYTAKERAEAQGIGHYVYPRFTRVIDTNETKNDINGAYNLISDNTVRNEMIISDTKAAIDTGRTPVILTRYKTQAKYLYEKLSGSADYVFILYGDNSDKENSEVRKALREVPNDKSMLLVATGQKIGEGFNFPRLDTLMLVAPVSFGGRLEQYVGRLHRDYKGKKDVVVYDYIDSHIRVFDNMYSKRLRTYRRLGYSLISNMIFEKQIANAI